MQLIHDQWMNETWLNVAICYCNDQYKMTACNHYFLVEFDNNGLLQYN